MDEKKIFEKLRKIFNRQDLQVLTENAIYVTDNVYSLYDEYFITKEDDKSVLLEKVNSNTTKRFCSLRNAVIWASLDKTNQIMDAIRVEYLDLMLAGAMANMEVHDSLAKSSKSLDYRATYVIKLQEDRVKKATIVRELDGFANRVKRWQEKRFKQISK